MQAVLSVLLATFAGFGVTMSANSILVEFLRWRQRQSSQHQGSQQATQPDRPPETVDGQTEPSHQETALGNTGTMHGS